MQDCGYAVGGAVATARSVIGSTLGKSGSKGEATKDVTRHFKRGRETESLKKKELSVTTQKCRLHKSASRQE